MNFYNPLNIFMCLSETQIRVILSQDSCVYPYNFDKLSQGWIEFKLCPRNEGDSMTADDLQAFILFLAY